MTMAGGQPDPFDRALERFSLAAKLTAAQNLLNWDAQTHMPPGGAWGRGEQMAALAEVGAGLLGAPSAAEELAEAEAMADALDPAARADLREMRRLWAHASAVPAELTAAKARMTTALRPVWVRAKDDDDFTAFAGPFEDLLGVIREIAAAKSDALSLSGYGALLDEYDPGVGEALIEPIFRELAAALPPLLADVRERQSSWPRPIPLPPAPADRQAALAHRLAQAVGHDPDHFRIDGTHHPFSMGHNPGDVRFTTRFDEDAPRFSITATLHEAGHAMYEFNLPRGLAFRPSGRARGMSVHESQSLSVERLAGGTTEFLGFLSGLARDVLGADPAWSATNLVNLWRRVDDGLIRVQAHEIAYPLHVIVRYRLELALLSGDLMVADLPGAWSDLFEELLGIRPPDHASGCLQDIHWASGLFGYFPNYAIGAVLAAQLFEQALADDPSIAGDLGSGDFRRFFAWTAPRVHHRASLSNFEDLVVQATGAPLGTEAFLRHLRRRYLEEPGPAA